MARRRGTSNQPVREIPNQTFGDRQRLTQLQQAAPLPEPEAPGETTPPSPGASVPIPQAPDVFGPSQSPTQREAPILPNDDFAILRALYERYPHPDLARLLERAAETQLGELNL